MYSLLEVLRVMKIKYSKGIIRFRIVWGEVVCLDWLVEEGVSWEGILEGVFLEEGRVDLNVLVGVIVFVYVGNS